jgi:hypothetical protein
MGKMSRATLVNDGAARTRLLAHGKATASILLLLLLSVGLALASAAAAPSPGSSVAPYTSPSKADADLRAFDVANPDCELWSNWHKTCARLGTATYCATDRAMPVKPSKAFCVGQWAGKSGDVVRSQMRFCRVRDSLSDSRGSFAICAGYDAGRPFNGRRLQARLSPACSEWRQDGSGTKARAYSSTGFYCTRFNRVRCRDGSFSEARAGARNAPGEIVAGYTATDPLDHRAVHGVWCGKGP